jgi:hypothetical protein
LQTSQKARRLIPRQRTKQATIADQWGFKRDTRIVCEFSAWRRAPPTSSFNRCTYGCENLSPRLTSGVPALSGWARPIFATSARGKLGSRERLLVWRQQAHLDSLLFGYFAAHGAVECLARREQRSDRSRGGTWAVLVAGTDRDSSDAGNDRSDQDSSNDIIAFHGGDPRSPPPQQPPAPSPVPFGKAAGESGIAGCHVPVDRSHRRVRPR